MGGPCLLGDGLAPQQFAAFCPIIHGIVMFQNGAENGNTILEMPKKEVYNKMMADGKY
jgi:hypothetical protein